MPARLEGAMDAPDTVERQFETELRDFSDPMSLQELVLPLEV